MEIKIISTEIIKPSSPTPDHLKTHKFFLPDNFFNVYFPIVFFYSAKRENATKISSHLKNSLSKTLTYYYPFAGQNEDEFSADCNDHGAIFIETRVVAGELSEVLRKKDNSLVKPLLPLNGNMQEIPTTYDHANLIVQVNHFGCGGIAISICFNHIFVDGATSAYFVKSWADVARGGANDIKNVVVDYSSITPPYEAFASLKSLHEQNHSIYPTGIVTKSFSFDGRKIAALRGKIGNGPFLDRPTRVEAISSLIAGTVIKNNEFTSTKMAVVFAINLRDKVNPPLPPQSMGNLLTAAIAKLPIGNNEINYNYLAAKIRESIRKEVDQYKWNRHGGDVVDGLANSTVLSISDVSKYPFYEADFGWAKPTWISFGVQNQKGAALVPSSDGEGVEVWIGLSKEEMAKFQQDLEILAYAKKGQRLDYENKQLGKHAPPEINEV